MKKHYITGKVVFQEIGSGFWGIVDDAGREWLPLNMPEQLKHVGQRVSVVAKAADVATVFMWGTPVQIIAFQTITPA
ncbi:MAG TPA: hypothetical protein PKD70_02660 [Saprospiraceae bacterium]|nr:hypothetical protein [Saprospiraceae bacterium]HMP12755.1 hypothetical protein [Saprospiraceae bacterium]